MDSSHSINAAILGASGYTGAELLRLLHSHPKVAVLALTGESQAGKSLAEVYPHFSALDYQLVRHEEVDYSEIDVVFCCLPHGTTQPIIAALPDSVRIVDLSADFRLHNLEAYQQWYGHPHQAAELQKSAVYGLTEHYREQIKEARLVANPGCYPTCTLLAVLPLVKAGLISPHDIIVDALSGISGAGRKASQANLFAEVTEGVKAYSVGGHRHVSEMEQEIERAAGVAVTLSFTPHLMPMSRGMSATIHAKTLKNADARALRDALAEAYQDEFFVQVCAEGVVPSTHEVKGTNQCKIAVFDDRAAGKVILVSVIDNLVKGASGQAIQNMNLMVGFEEMMGLSHLAMFP